MVSGSCHAQSPHHKRKKLKAEPQSITMSKRKGLFFNSTFLLAEMAINYFGNIDYCKFKAGTDIEKLTQMIGWCSEGIWNEGVQQHLSMSEMYEQSLGIHDFYKKAVYKDEYL